MSKDSTLKDFVLGEEKKEETSVAVESVERKKLTSTEAQLVSYIEQFWWTTEKVPSTEAISSELGLSLKLVTDTLEESIVIKALDIRGIDYYKKNNKVLTPQQTLVVNMLCNIHDKSSLRQQLELVGVSTQKFNTWMRDPVFQDYLKKRSAILFEGTDSTAYRKLSAAVENGDLNAIKFFFELRGIYNPKLQIDVSIEKVLVRVIDVITRHVDDPNILEAIATDLEGLAESA